MTLNPDTEICVTLGSKEGLANLAQAITAPGDVILSPNPSYPIHAFGFIIAGATIRSIPVSPGPEFFDALAYQMRYTVPRPTGMVIGYPANPTAETVDLDFYRQVVDFAKANDIWVISDLAYAEIYFDGNPPPSILEVEGGRDVAVEFTSLSKTFSMAGWRMGFAVGNGAADRRADAGQILSSTTAPSRPSRSPPSPRSTGLGRRSRSAGRCTNAAATC